MAENRRDEASERDNNDVFIEYGSGGRKITFNEEKGVEEGLSPVSYGIGKPGQGGLVSDQ